MIETKRERSSAERSVEKEMDGLDSYVDDTNIGE